MKYIIKNCDNCYCYDDEKNIKDKYWCECQKDNTLFANPCYKSDCLLKQIVEKCKQEIKRYEKGDYADELWEQAIGKNDKSEEILKLLEIEECEDE